MNPVIPYGKITQFSIESSALDMEADLKSGFGSDLTPIEKKFNRRQYLRCSEDYGDLCLIAEAMNPWQRTPACR